jgi:hypothetical protein
MVKSLLVLSTPQGLIGEFGGLTLCAQRWTPSGTCRVLGASLSLIVALLLRSAPYPDWRWQQVHFLKLLDGIRGGYTAKYYSLNVANCPGLLFCLNERPLFRRNDDLINAVIKIISIFLRLHPRFAQRGSKWSHSAPQSCWSSVQRVWKRHTQPYHSGHI